MPPPRRHEAWVTFDLDFWAEDLGRVTRNGRMVAEVWRAHEARRGVLFVPSLHVLAGFLADCAELPVPAPLGPWALIFAFAWDPASEQVMLDFLAFGPRHGPEETAYQTAARRRLGGDADRKPRRRRTRAS